MLGEKSFFSKTSVSNSHIVYEAKHLFTCLIIYIFFYCVNSIHILSWVGFLLNKISRLDPCGKFDPASSCHLLTLFWMNLVH